MLKVFTDLPEKILVFFCRSKYNHDYVKLLIPMVEDQLKKYGKIRLIYHLGTEFHHFSLMALWDDAKFGLAQWKEWEQIAVVTDGSWHYLQPFEGIISQVSKGQ